jgi:Methyltransferase domain
MNSLILRSVIKRVFAPIAEWAYSYRRPRFDCDLSFSDAVRQFPDRNVLYSYMHHYYRHLAPKELRRHRQFFSQSRRGFGEDALHAMWWLLLREFRPESCLEIGVYRGQVITLWALIAGLLGYSCDVHGVSPFSAIGDDVSRYDPNVDYYKDVQDFVQYFELKSPTLIRALSTSSEAVRHISLRKWSLIYIDGGHDFDTVFADYSLCANALAEGGLLVLDDSSLYTSFRPPAFSFAGHPGPSRVHIDHACRELLLLGGVGHNNVYVKRTA